MPFKIVQTIERGKMKLTTVPHQWEQNGILLWPRIKKQELLRKEEESFPEKNACRMNCIVKRQNIPSFQEAELEIDIMSNYSETETDNQTPKRRRMTPKSFNNMAEDIFEDINQVAATCVISSPTTETGATKGIEIITPKRRRIPPKSLNNILEECYGETNDINQVAQTSLISSPTTDVTNNLSFIINEEDYILLNSNSESLQLQENTGKAIPICGGEHNEKLPVKQSELKSIMEEIRNIKNDLQSISANQVLLFENQNAMMLQFSEVSTKFEEFIKLSFKTEKNSIRDDIKPISNLKDLEEFEKKLGESDSRDEIYKKFSVTCCKAVGKGITNAYSLIDTMFDRKFMKLCSWTGLSKGDATKICFKGFTRITDFFFNIVHQSDETFTRIDCQKFFKTILRNARQRCQSDQVRMSSQRRKQKGKPRIEDSGLSTSSTEQVIDRLQNPSAPSERNERELSDPERETKQLPYSPLPQDQQNDCSQ